MNTIHTKLGRTGRMAAALVGLTALLGACANNTPTSASDAGSVPATAAPAAATPAAPGAGAATSPAGAAGALLGTSEAGDILVGPDGRALYGFTNDTAAASTCYSTCAAAWPPVIVSTDWTVGPGLDTGIFATTVRDDGQLQLVAGKWPLYYYTGDAAPGDINGQGSGDVWFLVNPKGTLVKDVASGGGADEATATTGAGTSGTTGSGGYGAGSKGTTSTAKPATGGALVGTAKSALGDVLADAKGLTLYGFTADVGGKPSCYDACATAWPPMLVDSAELPAGLDPEVYSVVKRTDGTFQLKAGEWPLYRFGGDAAKGDVNGQGSGGKWFAAAPDGKLVKS